MGLTWVIDVVGIRLALLETSGLFLLRLGRIALVTCLVDLAVADIGLRHADCVCGLWFQMNDWVAEVPVEGTLVFKEVTRPPRENESFFCRGHELHHNFELCSGRHAPSHRTPGDPSSRAREAYRDLHLSWTSPVLGSV